MKIDNILEKFDNKSFSKIYLLETDEEVLIDEFLQNLKEKISNPEFNWSVYYAEEIDPAHFFRCLFSVPFLSQLKIITIKNASQLSSKIITHLSKNFKKIPGTNCLVFSDSEFSPSLKNLAPTDEQIISFGKTTRSKMKEWAMKYLKGNNKTMDPEALSLLLENTDLNFSLLARELDKLMLYVENKKNIEITDIKEIGMEIKTYDIFALIDNMSKKNTSYCLDALRGLLLDGTSPQQIIAMLRWQLSNIWQVKALISKGINNYKALEQAKIPYFKRSEFLMLTKKFKWEDLRLYLNLLLNADMQIKRGGDPTLTMELLLVKITK
ncbi:MAG: DNA polymerase III subunit delta [Candidatus Ratteibacteria bacterium]|nr:DNA polymerase III subunit delta [Candidatus Ratteibacteria bacterium]